MVHFPAAPALFSTKTDCFKISPSFSEIIRMLLSVGKQLLGRPTAGVVARIEQVADLAELERLTERVLIVADWQELFATIPLPPRRRRRP